MSYNYISHQCNLFEYKYSFISSKINFEHNIFPFYYLDIFFFHFFFDTLTQKKCPNNKKEIYNDKYRHTRDRLFGLSAYYKNPTKCIGLVQSRHHHHDIIESTLFSP
jgi:hypothetical protein